MNQLQINLLLITARADYGGGPEHIYRLIKSFSGSIKIFAACPRDFPYWDRYSEIAGNDRLIEIPHRKFELKYLMALVKFVRANNINIIHSHGKGAGIYSRLLSAITSIKCIHTSHGLHIGRYNILEKAVYIWIEKILGLYTSRLIAVSKGEYDLIKDYGLVKNSKLVLIPNGVNVGNSTISDEVFSRKIKVILSISRNDFAKNPELLPDIMKKLKELDNRNDYKLQIIGSGLLNPEFMKKFSDKVDDKSFEVTGTVNNPHDYIKEAFCYLSTSRSEGMPLGVLEAMSYGVPVVATNVIGNRDVIENGVTGYLYDINKPDEAAQFISKLADNYPLWKKMSGACRISVEKNYNVVQMAKEVQKEYIRALEKIKNIT